MQLYDWLMVTSIACVIVATISAVYLLGRLRQAIEAQTILIKESAEVIQVVPTEMKRDVMDSLREVKQKIQIGWKIFSFIRKRRQKRKLKKLQKLRKQEMRA